MTKRIVAASHLVSEKAGELSEFEYGLVMAGNAFNRWIARGMAASGHDISALEVQVLHSLNSRSRAKRLADICFTLNVEDTHTVNYAIKKLLNAGLVEREKRGKEQFYSTTEDGAKACEVYRAIRETCLVDAFEALGGIDPKEIESAARIMRALSGLYDQAARSATSL